MHTANHPIIPLDAIGFDVDGTLTSIEGITALAALNNVEKPVRTLTEQAMNETGMTPSIYAERLRMTQPTHKQCLEVAQQYIEHVTIGAKEVITKLQDQGIMVFICSAGLNTCVQPLAKHLGVAKENTYAVNIKFDNYGKYLDFDQNSPMTTTNGKANVVKKLKIKYPRIAFIGDGMNDAALKDEVNCFIGYGGAFYRESIKNIADDYIEEKNFHELIERLSIAIKNKYKQEK